LEITFIHNKHQIKPEDEPQMINKFSSLLIIGLFLFQSMTVFSNVRKESADKQFETLANKHLAGQSARGAKKNELKPHLKQTLRHWQGDI